MTDLCGKLLRREVEDTYGRPLGILLRQLKINLMLLPLTSVLPAGSGEAYIF